MSLDQTTANPVGLLPQWSLDAPVVLRDGVEIITGAGGRTMLVTPGGKFLSISAAGAALAHRLTGAALSGRDLLVQLHGNRPADDDRAARTLSAFLTDLRQAGALTIDPEPRTAKDKFNRLGKLDPVKRFPLVHDPARITAPLAGLLRRVPRAILAVIAAAVPVAALPLVWVALTAHRPTQAPVPAQLGAVCLLLLVQIAVHEAWHAIAMDVLDIRPRDAGVGLLFYAIPMAYVDRTDAYRFHGRAGRAFVSLAGPISDTFWMGVVALVVIRSSGSTQALWYSFLALQSLALVANLNPLFPTDGYHAVESALGSINMRSRALTFVLHKLSRTPLPAYLGRVPRRAKFGYAGYAVISSAYLGVVLWVLLANVLHLLGRL